MSTRVTAKEFQQMLKKKHKYGVAPKEERTLDGVTFASKAEMRRYCQLKLMEKVKDIQDLKLQPKFELYAGIKYVADFSYYENSVFVVEDVKGMVTPVYRIKKKMLLHKYPNLDFREVK
ncbi:MAG: DUF1064 domain-containing protein [bacterium]